MPAYPKTPLEDKLAWMRERQKQKEETTRRKEGKVVEERRVEQAAAEQQRARLQGTIAQLNRAKHTVRRSPIDDLPPERKMLRVEAVALLLSVSVRTVRRWFRDRAIVVPTGPCKTTMLISQAALDDWFKAHEPKPNSR